MAKRQKTKRQSKEILLISTAAHDLRNPLSAIFGYAEALLMEPGEHSMSSKQREIVLRMRGATLRGLELAKNLQALSHAPRKAGLSHSMLLGGINAAVESVWFPPEKNIAFSQHSALDALTRVSLDQYEVERIVANLLSNAIKYSPTGAGIWLEVQQSKNYANIIVRNSGSFIPANERRVIFERFARGKISNLTSGSGLGLSIVAGLVRKAHGSVTVTSTKKNGTTFLVRLPLLKSGLKSGLKAGPKSGVN